MTDVFRRFVWHNLGLNLFEPLALAIALWLAVAHDPVAEIAVNVPIQFQQCAGKP